MTKDLSGEIRERIERMEAIPTSYWEAPLPGPQDDEIVALVDYYKRLDRSWRPLFVSMSQGDAAQGRLNMFAGRMAMLGVREQAPQRLQDALVALIITGFPLENHYSLLMTLSLVHHSVVKLNLDVAAFFEEALQYTPRPAANQHPLREFIAREPRNKSIQAMGFQEFEGPHGIVYWNGTEANIPKGWL